MTKKIITGGIGVIFAGFICFCGWLILGGGSTYYTQISNNSIKASDSEEGVINLSGDGGLDFSYTLTAYDENGKEKEITFGSSKELQEGAFIRLQVMPVRGVLNWNEVSYGELPAAVREHYTSLENA